MFSNLPLFVWTSPKSHTVTDPIVGICQLCGLCDKPICFISIPSYSEYAKGTLTSLFLSLLLSLPLIHSVTLYLNLTEFQSVVCREVTLPPGPLYRVAGFSMSLPCTVSGYEGPRTQDFEWFLFRETAAEMQLGVVSTRDRGFPYAPYLQRVKSGEVRVERDSGDKARLVIQRLRPEDQGRYECYTPSTDTRYQGSYNAAVVVKGSLHEFKMENTHLCRLIFFVI